MSANTLLSQVFYTFKANTIKHQVFDFATLQGKTVLIVNTASKCGFTPQYKGLEELHQKYKDRGLVIIGFPCDQFGGQEPENEEGIESFCTLNYGVSFQMMEKIDVNGDNAHPVFKWLKAERKSFLMERIKWNFEKFLIDKTGRLIERYASITKPESMEAKIESIL